MRAHGEACVRRLMTAKRKVLELCNHVMRPGCAGLVYSPNICIFFFSKCIYGRGKTIQVIMSSSTFNLSLRLLQGVKVLLLKDALTILSVFFKYSLSPAGKQSSEYPLCLQQRELMVRTWSQSQSSQGGILALRFTI